MKTRSLVLIMIALCGAWCVTSCGSGLKPLEGGGAAGVGVPGEPLAVSASLKLVRLDGTTLEFSSRPIPRMIGVQMTFSSSIPSGTRSDVESSFCLAGSSGPAVAGRFVWSTDGTQTVFWPSKPLRYAAAYAVSFAAAPSSQVRVTAASDVFTTLTRGDVNGDGIADLAIGADGASSPGRLNNGEVYVFHGGSLTNCRIGVDCAPQAILRGAATGDNFGVTVASAGDVNADGFEDLIAGAPTADVDGGLVADRGEAALFLGSAAGIASCDLMSCTPAARISGVEDALRFGSSVAGVGDIDGDGYGDVLVGAPLAGAPSSSGRAYLFKGYKLSGALSPDAADERVNGAANENMGFAVSGAGDVNADGFDDVLIGAPGPFGSISHAYFFLGKATGIGCAAAESCAPAKVLAGGSVSSAFGYAVASAGDVNNDGFGDVLVGGLVEKDGAVRPGRAYLYLGSTAGLGGVQATITGQADQDFLGMSVAGVGDMNGDGYGDVLIGARNAKAQFGAAYLFHGSASGLTSCKIGGVGCGSMTTITGPQFLSAMGTFVGGGSDLDGDGHPDVFAGAPGTDVGGGVHAGGVFVWNGTGDELVDCNLSGGCSAQVRMLGNLGTDDFGIVAASR